MVKQDKNLYNVVFETFFIPKLQNKGETKAVKQPDISELLEYILSATEAKKFVCEEKLSEDL